ncbi:NUDIX hydrolase [Celeribacter indicus]|uniref:NUDIX family hydrolase n=1 Tax=Celeribacter indicus TaxID=1208324 RepID=A0A0B5DS33_9RHOB|nr:NUDIX hydrolase [Celeribacter indicus]AJE46333.1 NUDIX family hydrolase [Celeribacter indicus]SDW53655.1 ADP-ribose pyrophosphatase YjhB, NUDIX family [Celeribacter indicus]
MSARPKLAVLAVCRAGDRLLLVRRANPPDAGLWGFPGGHVEWGEPLARAAERELSEETGVRGAAGGILDHVEVIAREEEGRVTHHFLLVAVACRYLDGTVAAGDDALEAGWFTQAEIAGCARSDQVLELAGRALAREEGDPGQ